MMMPTCPRPRLVVSHPEVNLSLHKVLLYTPKPARYERHRLQRLLRRSVHQKVFRLRAVQRASDQQPDWRTWLPMSHGPNTNPSKLKHQGTNGTFSQLKILPRFYRQAVTNTLNRVYMRSPFFSRRTTSTLWVHGPHSRVHWYLDDVFLRQCLHPIEKRTVSAVLLICNDPIELNRTCDTALQQLQCNLGFGTKFQLLGYACFLATRPIFDPAFRQVQLVVQQGRTGWHRTNEEYPDLAILYSSESATVLPSDTNALFPLFGKPRFVDDSNSANRPISSRRSKLFGKHFLDFALNRIPLPRGRRDKSLHANYDISINRIVIGAVTEYEGHWLDALASMRRQQTVQICKRMLSSFDASKKGSKAPVQPNQFIRRCAQFVRSHGNRPPDENQTTTNWPVQKRVFCMHETTKRRNRKLSL